MSKWVSIGELEASNFSVMSDPDGAKGARWLPGSKKSHLGVVLGCILGSFRMIFSMISDNVFIQDGYIFRSCFQISVFQYCFSIMCFLYVLHLCLLIL